MTHCDNTHQYLTTSFFRNFSLSTLILNQQAQLVAMSHWGVIPLPPSVSGLRLTGFSKTAVSRLQKFHKKKQREEVAFISRSENRGVVLCMECLDFRKCVNGEGS